jgi:glutathionylspermidine synthase
VKLPWVAGRALSPEEWKHYLKQVVDEGRGCKMRPEDFHKLSKYPLLLGQKEWLTLAKLAEKLTEEALAAEQELAFRFDLHQTLGISTRVREALRRSSRRPHPKHSPRFIRFDFHFTTEGWRISEINADVLGGFVEASSVTGLMAPFYPGFSAPPNATLTYARAIRKAAGKGASVAIVRRDADSRYLELKYLAQELERLGLRVVMASPGDLRWKPSQVRLFSLPAGGRLSMLIRMINVGGLQKLRPGRLWKPWFSRSRTPVSNPISCLFIENKRFPLLWNELNTPMPTWRTVLPEIRCPSEFLAGPGPEWIFKPAYGRVGESVAIQGVTTREAYQQIVRSAERHPARWAAQRRFESVAVPTGDGPRYVCLGIYTVDGKAAGIYARMARKALIDVEAEDIVVLIGD